MTQAGGQQKSTYEIWQFWAKALDRQMRRCADVYKEHQEDAKKAQTIIDRLEYFIDPVAHAQQLAAKNYDVKGSVNKLYLLSLTVLQKVFRDTLDLLPAISEDMQRLLHSPCYGECSGRQAMDIFKGPHRTTHEGIAAGIPDERGGLPWAIAKILDEADFGGDEYFNKGLNNNPTADNSDSAAATGTERHDSYKPRKKETLTGIS